MDLILLNAEMSEIGPVKIDIDFEVGDSSALNNFELDAVSLNAAGIYVPGTEYGGLFEYNKGSNKSGEKTIKGWTWRGLLSQAVICPPTGSDYMMVSGEANAVIKMMLSNVLGGFFYVPEKDSGLIVNNYQFKLYCTYLEGLMDMLAVYGYRLSIHAEKIAAGQPVQVIIEAVPVVTVSGVYTDDSPVKMSITDNRMGINHLVCMGKGDLQERMRVDLYIDAVGNVSQNKYYTGFEERTAYYDYKNAESLDDLVKHGTTQLIKLASGTKLSIDAVDHVDLSIGDIVRGYKDELMVEAPLVKTIFAIKNGRLATSYSVKGER